MFDWPEQRTTMPNATTVLACCCCPSEPDCTASVAPYRAAWGGRLQSQVALPSAVRLTTPVDTSLPSSSSRTV
jgi:hypothetical protein